MRKWFQHLGEHTRHQYVLSTTLLLISLLPIVGAFWVTYSSPEAVYGSPLHWLVF